jgi:hypothetical protein
MNRYNCPAAGSWICPDTTPGSSFIDPKFASTNNVFFGLERYFMSK